MEINPGKEFDCVVLAAGFSSRMGQWKPILPYRDTTIIDCVIRTALINCRKTILVCGYRWSELYARYRKRDNVEVIFNNRYAEGILSSARKGAEFVSTDRFFLVLADLPAIEPDTYKTMIKHSPDDILVSFPVFNGKRGHPVLVSGSAIPMILEAKGYENTREFLESLTCVDIEVNDPGILEDIDSEQDYFRLRGRHAL